MEAKRLEVMKGKVLSQNMDKKLQEIVTAASSISGYPVAIINLILHRTQHYRAFVGLDGDLAAYRSTDSCLSFCQYVVKTNKPLKIQDATKEPTLPQLLIKMYGIRAYCGYPLKIDNEVVGALCIVDVKPNSIDEAANKALIELADKASQRLTALANEHSANSFAEIKVKSSHEILWQEIAQARQSIQIAITDLFPVVQAMSSTNQQQDPVQLQNAKSYLVDSTKAYADLKAALDQLDGQLKKLKQIAK